MASLGGSADVMVGKVTFRPVRLEARPDTEPRALLITGTVLRTM